MFYNDYGATFISVLVQNLDINLKIYFEKLKEKKILNPEACWPGNSFSMEGISPYFYPF